MACKFKIGDRVKIIKQVDHLNIGDLGTVLENSYLPYVDLDIFNTRNHHEKSIGRSGHVWAITEGKMELVKSENISYEIY